MIAEVPPVTVMAPWLTSVPEMIRLPPADRISCRVPSAALVNVPLRDRIAFQLLSTACRAMMPWLVNPEATVKVVFPRAKLPCTARVILAGLLVASVTLVPPIRMVVGEEGLLVALSVQLDRYPGPLMVP